MEPTKYPYAVFKNITMEIVEAKAKDAWGKLFTSVKLNAEYPLKEGAPTRDPYGRPIVGGKFSANATVVAGAGSGYLGNCGTSSWTSVTASFSPTTYGSWNTYMQAVYWAHSLMAQDPNLFNQVRDAMLDNFIRKDHGVNAIMFGGRTGYEEAAYINMMGIYSGSLAKHIADSGLGTITMSHPHHNPLHPGPAAYSVQQVYIWSPPKQLVLPVKKAYCGIFGDKKHRIAKFKEEQERLKKDVTWELFYPNYIQEKFIAKPDTVKLPEAANMERVDKAA